MQGFFHIYVPFLILLGFGSKRGNLGVVFLSISYICTFFIPFPLLPPHLIIDHASSRYNPPAASSCLFAGTALLVLALGKKGARL